MRHRGAEGSPRTERLPRRRGLASPVLAVLVIGLASCKGAPPVLPPVPPGSGQVLVASGPLGTLYAVALKLAGCAVLQADADDAVRTGLFEAAKRLGWTGPVSESSLS